MLIKLQEVYKRKGTTRSNNQIGKNLNMRLSENKVGNWTTRFECPVWLYAFADARA